MHIIPLTENGFPFESGYDNIVHITVCSLLKIIHFLGVILSYLFFCLLHFKICSKYHTYTVTCSTLENADIWTSSIPYLHPVLTFSTFQGNFVLLSWKLYKMPNAQNGTQKPLRTQHSPAKCQCKAARALYPLVMNGLFHLQ